VHGAAGGRQDERCQYSNALPLTSPTQHATLLPSTLSVSTTRSTAKSGKLLLWLHYLITVPPLSACCCCSCYCCCCCCCCCQNNGWQNVLSIEQGFGLQGNHLEGQSKTYSEWCFENLSSAVYPGHRFEGGS
jgi:hypothetical protein